MSKKNRDIQVIVEEEKIIVNDQAVSVSKVIIGKKEIGRIIPQTNKKYAVEISGKQEIVTKDIEEGILFIIRQWNLHE